MAKPCPSKACINVSENSQNSAVKEAAQALARGRLVAFPTETVYGLGADAMNPEALKSLFEAKGRPKSHPVIVHVEKLEDAEKWCSEFPEQARILGKVFWPGPLTMVLKKARHVPDELTGGQNTIAIRVPSHPLAQALLKEFAGGIAAPSANRFGHLSATSADDVQAEFRQFPDLIVLDGGSCEVGIESTIVDLTGEQARILRPGMIQAESIFVALAQENSENAEPESNPRVPGSLPSHYAPTTQLKLVPTDEFLGEIENLEHAGQDLAVLSFKPAPTFARNWISAKDYAPHYAHTLYRNLRKLDGVGADLIIVEEPPQTADWDAIRDRLKRAAGLKENKEEESDGS